MNSKKIISLVVSVFMVVTAMIPAAVCADTTWTSPAKPMTVDNNTIKVGAHAAVCTAVFFLGGNNIVERSSDYSEFENATTDEAAYEAAIANTKLGVFGTSINDSPDPYLWNYLYNKAVAAGKADGEAVDDAVLLTDVRNPVGSDTTIVDQYGTSVTLARRPDILMDTKGGYDELIAKLPENTDADKTNDYNPIQLTYGMSTLYDIVDSVYTLSDAMKKVTKDTGKTGRYGDTDVIAQKYEGVVRGLQMYILSELEKRGEEKKTVAVIDPSGVDTNDDGVPDKYECYTSAMGSGTSASCKGAEYVEGTTKNIIDVCGLKPEQAEQTDRFGNTSTVTKYYATVEQLCSMDAIVTGVQGASTTDEKLAQQFKAADSTITDADIPPTHTVDPQDVFPNIISNGAEAITGVTAYQGFIYPELLNPIYATMYIYKNLWHVSDQNTLIALANANFANASNPEGIKVDGTGFDEKDIAAKIQQGINYYNKHESEFKGTHLEMTSHIKASTFETTKASAISKTKIKAIANQTYKGSTIKPSVKVTGTDGKTLKNGTDYTVTYSNNKKIGTATVKITGKGNYSGTKTATFKIVPKGTKIKNLKKGKKSITVKWSKQSSQKPYYQISYATNSKFSKAKTVAVRSNKAVTKTIKKLKSGKKYYVKIRTYKTVSKKNYYSNWSKAETVKTK